MANKLDAIKAFVQANPSASWWIEEGLFRGGPGANGGIIRGAHIAINVQYTDVDGEVRVRTFGPYPVNNLPNGVTMAETLQAIRISQQNTIEIQAADIVVKQADITAKQATITAHVAELATRQTTIDQKTADLAAKQETIQQRDTALASKQATIDTQVTQIAVMQAEIDRLTDLAGE